MKKGILVTLIILLVIALAVSTFLAIYYHSIITRDIIARNEVEDNNMISTDLSNKENMKSTKRAVVVKADEKYLGVMGFENTNDLYSVSYAEEGNIGFKQGQEILIYYDGTALLSFPAQINNVGKIEIVKEESDTQIPDDVLRYWCNSRDNVKITINELNANGITLTITDMNKVYYEYDGSYTIYKKIKNENYRETESNIVYDAENSIYSYIRNR